jgi:hypothetical protein
MAIDLQTLQAALTGYQSEHARLTRAIAGLRAQIKSGKASGRSGPDEVATEVKPRRKMPAAARKRIAAAQKKRWAEYHKAQKAQA